MRKTVNLSRGMGMLIIVAAAQLAAAQNPDLREAIDLFDKQDYAAAQAMLLKIGRDGLDEADRAELDLYLKKLPEAVQGAAQAKRDQAGADEAHQAGRMDEAERLYNAVLNNLYAGSALKEAASAQLSRIAAKRDVAEAVPPSGGSDVVPAAQEQPVAPEQPADAMSDAPEPAPPVTSRRTLLDAMKNRDRLLWQRAVAKMEDLVNRARDAVDSKDFTTARQEAQSAMQWIEAARNYAEPAEKYENAKARVAALQIEIEDGYRQYSKDVAEQQRVQIKDSVAEKRRLHDEKLKQQIEQLFNSADQLRKEGRFAEAAEMLRQILYLEPGNVRARHELDIAQDYEAFATQQRIHDDRTNELRRTFIDAEETKIPWTREVLYPSNWLQISARRDRAGVGVSGETDDARELNRQLDDILPEINFEEQPFEGVIEFLQDLKGINISVDWEDLEVNGVERDKPVTLKLANLSFRTVFKELLVQTGGDVVLGFVVSDGLLKIATKEKLDRDKEIRVYDINDLLVNIPRFTNAAQLNPSDALNQAGQGGGSGGGGGGGGGGNLFEDNEDNDQDDQGEGGRGALVEEIMDIIRQTVETDSWRETGAGDGSIRELNGQLIVYNTSDAHQQIQDLLSQLRQFRALQISIETRFLTVSSNFLEEIGVDLDFVFNSGSAGFDPAFAGNTPLINPFTGTAVLIPRGQSQIGVLPNVPGFGTAFPIAVPGPSQPFLHPGLVPANGGISPHFSDVTPIPLRQGSMNLVNPANILTGVPGSFADAFRSGAVPALSIAGSFLDNLQVDFLIRATLANSRSSIVQAPRLILFNGQRSNIFVGRSQTYVASLQPQIAQQAVAFQPIIGVAQSGSSLDIEATISADRRYVTVTVRTQRAQDPVLTRFEIQRASGNAPGAFITTVDQQSASINTTVSIPDGGTVLLGGLKQVGEVEIEAGVPILSKIPILKRAFTNTTTVKDTSTLLILMKAKIIIQKEAEDEAFPEFIRTAGA